ncbi:MULTISPECIES: RNase J family beta-CASP ribonuclease [Paenibacillus]|uniref:ribonuclease J n=1 Tax=Paenibacillus TaxID=44249 RepID=UPI000410EB12
MEHSKLKTQKPQKTSRYLPPAVRIFALGGLGEIGKNMYGIEYKNEIILIDAGLKFPDAHMNGVDYIIPDIRYLLDKPQQIKALFLTHGHEDHIGAIPYLLRHLSFPIYGGALTIGLVKAKLEEHKLTNSVDFHIIQDHERVSFQQLSVHFFRTIHSIPDAFGIVVDTPYGSIVHTGDFKFDMTPEGKTADLHKMMQLGEKGVLALLSDSTNSEREGQSLSEQTVGESVLELIQQCEGRVLFATFASNVHRLQQVIHAASECNRRILILGRSMEKIFSIGQELGHLHIPQGMLMNMKEIHTTPHHQVIILCTGSQGEPNAALTRIAAGSHRHVQIFPGDMVVFSSSPIPGNVIQVNRSIDMLMRSGAAVLYGAEYDIHTSGHGSREDLKLMIRTMRPKYFIPIHGEYRMLVSHQKLAEQVGIPSNRIYVLNNGEPLLITKYHARKGRNLPSGSSFVIRGKVERHEPELIDERNRLAKDGVLIVALVLNNETCQMISGPDLISRGFVYVRDANELMKTAESHLKSALYGLEQKKEARCGIWERKISEVLQNFFYSQLQRTPVIFSSIHSVSHPTQVKDD